MDLKPGPGTVGSVGLSRVLLANDNSLTKTLVSGREPEQL